MLQTSGLFLSAHADRPVISTGTPHVTASQTNISAPRRQSRRQVPEKEKKGLGMLPRPRFADRARFELAEGCPSTVFKTVSLGRSDTCPDARSHAQVFIIQKGGMLIFGTTCLTFFEREMGSGASPGVSAKPGWSVWLVVWKTGSAWRRSGRSPSGSGTST